MINNEHNLTTLKALVENDDFVALRNFLVEMNAVDIAYFFNTIADRAVIVKVFKLLPEKLEASTFIAIDSELQQTIMEELMDSEIAKLFNEIYTDDAVDVLEEMPSHIVNKVLKNISIESNSTIEKLLSYPDNVAGSIMNTDILHLHKDFTVEETFEQIRIKGSDCETLNTFYISSREGKLQGVVSARDLLLADPKAKLSDIMHQNVIYATTRTDKEEVASTLTKYGFQTLPIINSHHKFVGLVTLDDVIDVIHERSTKEIQKMAGIRPTEKPYLKTSVWSHSLSRIPWLIVLAFSAILTGQVIVTFEDALLVLPILMSFIPLLMDTAGNSGSQSSAMVIRGMALDEIKGNHFLKIIRKEVTIGFICGVAVGAANFIRILIQYHKRDDVVMLGLVVFLGLLATVVVAKALGAILPLVAKMCKVDPATMSAPVITTIADISSLMVFFAFAKILLNI